MFRATLNKHLLKRTLVDHLPHEALYGRKYGFGYSISIGDLLNGPWRSAVDAFVRRGRYLDLGIFSQRGVEWAIQHSPVEVWRLLVFSLWAEMYLFGEQVESVADSVRRSLPSSSAVS
jgi:hypothetical protein